MLWPSRRSSTRARPASVSLSRALSRTASGRPVASRSARKVARVTGASAARTVRRASALCCSPAGDAGTVPASDGVRARKIGSASRTPAGSWVRTSRRPKDGRGNARKTLESILGLLAAEWRRSRGGRSRRSGPLRPRARPGSARGRVKGGGLLRGKERTPRGTPEVGPRRLRRGRRGGTRAVVASLGGEATHGVPVFARSEGGRASRGCCAHGPSQRGMLICGFDKAGCPLHL